MSRTDGEMRRTVDLVITPDVTKIPPAGERLSSFDLKGDNSHRVLLRRFVLAMLLPARGRVEPMGGGRSNPIGETCNGYTIARAPSRAEQVPQDR